MLQQASVLFTKTNQMSKFLLLLSMVSLMAISCEKENEPDVPGDTPRTEVPGAIVGTWVHGSIDFELWENYRQGYYAGRNATPSREAMIFEQDGTARFFRYEFAFNMYEELIDCRGTVAFNDDGTFTFYPTSGRKRFYDTHYPEKNTDRALGASELNQPKIAGKRGYTYDGSSDPPRMEIRVPNSAPYNWYKMD